MSLTADSLVFTKLRPSQARPVWSRGPADSKAGARSRTQADVVSAPAGFGKTTLLGMVEGARGWWPSRRLGVAGRGRQ